MEEEPEYSYPRPVPVFRREMVVMEMHNHMFMWVKYEVRLFLTEEKPIWRIRLTMSSSFAH